MLAHGQLMAKGKVIELYQDSCVDVPSESIVPVCDLKGAALHEMEADRAPRAR